MGDCIGLGKRVRLVDRPRWARSLVVDADGNLKLTTSTGGLSLIVR